jgi:hypothetical protein
MFHPHSVLFVDSSPVVPAFPANVFANTE